ncbi:MAG: hypothetical protein Q9157_000444 [Trypethelium eluteriae]
MKKLEQRLNVMISDSRGGPVGVFDKAFNRIVEILPQVCSKYTNSNKCTTKGKEKMLDIMKDWKKHEQAIQQQRAKQNHSKPNAGESRKGESTQKASGASEPMDGKIVPQAVQPSASGGTNSAAGTPDQKQGRKSGGAATTSLKTHSNSSGK